MSNDYAAQQIGQSIMGSGTLASTGTVSTASNYPPLYISTLTEADVRRIIREELQAFFWDKNPDSEPR